VDSPFAGLGRQAQPGVCREAAIARPTADRTGQGERNGR